MDQSIDTAQYLATEAKVIEYAIARKRVQQLEAGLRIAGVAVIATDTGVRWTLENGVVPDKAAVV